MTASQTKELPTSSHPVPVDGTRQNGAPWAPVLMYHAIEDSRSVIATSPEVFAWQMQWLYENGYTVIGLGQLVECLYGGEGLPERSVAVTFDDGFESVFTQAYPILSRYGFSATVFLVADYCGRQNDWPGQPSSVPRRSLLTWAQIRELHQDGNGVEFGAHGVGHPRLDELTADEMAHEVLGSKAVVEDRLGHEIGLFSYPYGRHSTLVRTVVQREYRGACTAHLDVVKPGSDPFALPRIDAHYVAHPMIFRQLLRPVFPLYIGLRRPLRALASFVLQRPWK